MDSLLRPSLHKLKASCQMQLADIYNQLFAGKKLRLILSRSEISAFRAKLFRYKSEQDKALEATGLIDQTQMLSFKCEQMEGEDSDCVRVTLSFRDRGYSASYKVLILEDEES